MAGWANSKRVAVERAFYGYLNRCYVNSKDAGRICLGECLYEGQRQVVTQIFDALEADIHKIFILKSRQLGISTIIRALIIFLLGVHKGLKGAIIFDTDNNKSEARAELEVMINDLPSSLKFPAISGNNRAGLTLANDSKVLFMSAGVRKSKTSGTLGRSVGLTIAHLSELCSYDNDEGLEAFEQSLSEVHPDRLYIYESPLALDTPVVVPNGWKNLGDLKVGDYVYDERGKPCHVIGLSPIFINRKCYRITFSNGDSVVSDSEHKWEVVERRWPTNPQWTTKVVKTSELDIENHRIEIAEPLYRPEIDLPIDPYLLGLWLGDGISGQGSLVAGDEDMGEVRDLLVQRGLTIGPVSKNNWRVGKFTVAGLRGKLATAGLLGNKHIPAVYLRASEQQRRDLLCGLMDSDGHIGAGNRQCNFANTSMRLLDDVEELLSSLGIKFKRSVNSAAGKLRKFPNGRTYACALSERLLFCEQPDRAIFSLARKKKIQTEARNFTFRKAKYLKIVSVEEVPSVPVRCISVNSPSHLFLVGKTMVPTHNTARGFNRWHAMWQEARKDPHHCCCIFLGWFVKNSQSIPRDSVDFALYGDASPSEEEREKIALVKQLYGYDITPEQLAWVRRKYNPSATTDNLDADDEEADPVRTQEQPWTEDEAFQQTGSIFFPAKQLTDQTLKHVSNKYQRWMYIAGAEFTDMKIYPAPTLKMTDLKVWEEPDPDGVYIIGCDPAFGENPDNDRSGMQIMRCYSDGIDQVAEYASPLISTRQLAWVIASLLGWYGGGNAQVCYVLELNGPGQAVFNALKELRFQLEQGYFGKDADEKGLVDIFRNVRTYIYTRPDGMTAGQNFHFKTSSALKVMIMERLRDFVSNGSFRIRSQALVEEMKTIARDGDSISAPQNMRDDLVLSAAFAGNYWETKIRKDLITQRKTRASEEARKRLSIVDQVKLFNQSQLGYFFQQKQVARQQLARQASRARWRSR